MEAAGQRASGEGSWALIAPNGEVRARERTQIRAWARLGGYKPTVENLLALEEQGWRVQEVLNASVS